MKNQVNVSPRSFGITETENTFLIARVIDNGLVVYLREENKKGLACVSYDWTNDYLMQEKKGISLLEKMMQEFNSPDVKILTPKINRVYSAKMIDSLTGYFINLNRSLEPEVLETPYSDDSVNVI